MKKPLFLLIYFFSDRNELSWDGENPPQELEHKEKL